MPLDPKISWRRRHWASVLPHITRSRCKLVCTPVPAENPNTVMQGHAASHAAFTAVGVRLRVLTPAAADRFAPSRCSWPRRSLSNVTAKAESGKYSKRSVGGRGATGKGFGAVPEPGQAKRSPERLEIIPPSDFRPLVDGKGEEFVPRGPTMRKDYQERGLMETDSGPDAGVLPQVVADRMIRRIAGFAGVPLVGLFVFFGAYFVAKYKYDISVIPVVVAYTTLGCIGSAGVGITYGIMSSSWDPDVEGTGPGFKEAKTNMVRARDGLLTMLNLEKQEDARVKDMQEVNKWRKEMGAVKEKKGRK
jgi:Photosynthesis affected mutant 68